MECSAVKEAGGLVQNLKEDNLKVTDILQIRHGKENYRLIFVVVVTISAAFWQGIVIYLTSIRAINCKLHNVINCLVYKKNKMSDMNHEIWIAHYKFKIMMKNFRNKVTCGLVFEESYLARLLSLSGWPLWWSLHAHHFAFQLHVW